MPGPHENKRSEVGMVKRKTLAKEETVRGIEDHAGERGRQDSVVFKMPKDGEICDHSRVRDLD